MKTLFLLFVGLIIGGIANAQMITENDLINYISANQATLYTAEVVQAGIQNSANIEASTVSLTQVGSNQQFYYTETSIMPSALTVNMEGTNNYVEVFGNNEIINDMTINITGNDRMVIIRNYP